MTELEVASRGIGPGHPPYVIAEISANHRGSKAAAIELIHAAREAGADAVKFQHYTPGTITVECDHPDFRVGGGTLWDGRTLGDLYSEAMMPWEWTPDLVAEASRVGITWLSSPFDPSAVDFLVDLDVPAMKIASFEIVDIPLIRYAAATGRPLIISTGMASIAEIDSAVQAARDGGAQDLTLLRCNSGYPARPQEMDLRAIPQMAAMWGLPVGLSDHTLGVTAAVTATALGACIIEKHLTWRRSDGGPDAEFSAEPAELALLVSAVREAHEMLGTVRFGPSEREAASIKFRRSLRAVRSIAAGERITDANVRSVRPAGGLPPEAIEYVVGMTAARSIELGAPVAWSDLSGRDVD